MPKFAPKASAAAAPSSPRVSRITTVRAYRGFWIVLAWTLHVAGKLIARAAGAGLMKARSRRSASSGLNPVIWIAVFVETKGAVTPRRDPIGIRLITRGVTRP